MLKIAAYCLLAIFILSSGSPIYAQQKSIRELMSQGIYYYDNTDLCVSGDQGGPGSPAQTGGTVSFPLDDGTQPRVQNSTGAGTAQALSPQAKRGAQLAYALGHKNGISGIRAPDGFDEHSSGKAIDILSSNMGTAVPPGEEFDFLNSLAETFRQNHQALSVSNVIWDNKIASSRENFAWRSYSGYGQTSSPTLQHKDHIHVFFTEATGTEQISLQGSLSLNSDSQPNRTQTEAAPSILDGHELPATKGGVGLEDPVTAAGNLVGQSETVTFAKHAKLGQEYRDYYITMRWNYASWYWNGDSTDVDNDEYNWFSEKPRLVLVTNPKTNKSIITAAIEAGPAPWTGVDGSSNNTPKQGWKNPQRGTPSQYEGRVSGLPPEAFKALGMTSVDQKFQGNGTDLLYSWAPDQNAKPGPTNLSVNDSPSITAQNQGCACTVDNSNEFTKTTSGDVDKFIKALAQQESGGDPAQPGSAGGARGKYQYIDSTWQSSAETYYPPALRFSQAHLAPESVQDAVAFLEYSKKFKDLNNDLFKLAVSHFYPIANSDPGQLDVVPPANVITPRQYANKLIDSIRSGGPWESIPLKYSEAPDFNKYARNVIEVDETTTGNSLPNQLCATEQSEDGPVDSVSNLSWPVDKKFWDTNQVWFTKPHHTYAASDIGVPSGNKVYSMTEGKVTSAGNQGNCGVAVFIKYKPSIDIGYCHGTEGSLKVKTGDTIRPGQLIMLSGNTGRSTGPHLHIQIKVGGELRCPQPIFRALAENTSIKIEDLPNSGCIGGSL